MRRRILVLPLAAAIIAGLVIFKLGQTPRSRQQPAFEAEETRPAPLFQLHNENSKRFRLTRYLGRHKMLIVFFDPSSGADQNAQLQVLKEHMDELKRTGAYILAISEATPYANRESIKRGGKFPFPLLSDPILDTQRLWGVIDRETSRPVEGVFVIDRAGMIRWSRVAPEAPIDSQTLVEELNRAP